MDRVKHRWVRSGLALGSDKLPLRSMSYVQLKHIARSKTKRRSERFEFLFPGRTLDCDSLIRRGWFQNLYQYCVVGFSRNLDVTASCMEDEGIFSWDKKSLEEINRLK